MPRQKMSDDEFSSILMAVFKAKSEADLALLIRQSHDWNPMSELQIRKFEIAMNAHQDYLDDVKRIIGMSPVERNAYVEFNTKFDYRKYLESITDDREKFLGYKNAQRNFDIELRVEYRKRLTVFAAGLEDPQGLISKPLLPAFITKILCLNPEPNNDDSDKSHLRDKP